MTSPAPVVTVVIPCYRQERYLAEAIESAEAQAGQPVQVIVVDDGSPDGTAELASRYPGVELIRQSNQGLTAARNAGLAAARGDFIVFLDADDRLTAGALSAGLAALAAAPHAIMAAGRCRLIDAGGGPIEHPGPRPCPGGDHYDLLLRHNHIWPPAVVLYRRGMLAAAGGWGQGRRRAEDVELYLRLARNHPIQCHPTVVAEYRQQPRGLSADRGAMLAALDSILREQRSYVADHGEYRAAYVEAEREWPVYYGELLADDVRADLLAHRWRDAADGMNDLLRYYPRAARTIFAQAVRWILPGRRRRARDTGS
ncbi:MAG TPA: glycosyltransferase [Gemmatimonadales bacterium]|nr:glycosyltransferase [Gemmatimonadales bacterium]